MRMISQEPVLPLLCVLRGESPDKRGCDAGDALTKSSTGGADTVYSYDADGNLTRKTAGGDFVIPGTAVFTTKDAESTKNGRRSSQSQEPGKPVGPGRGPVVRDR